MVLISGMFLWMNGSRAPKTFSNLVIFIATVGVTSTEGYMAKVFLGFALAAIFPYALVYSMQMVLALGYAMDVTDEDLAAASKVREYVNLLICGVMGYVVCLEGCISILLLSFSNTTTTTAGALGSPGLLSSYSIIIPIISLHITTILTMTCLSVLLQC